MSSGNVEFHCFNKKRASSNDVIYGDNVVVKKINFSLRPSAEGRAGEEVSRDSFKVASNFHFRACRGGFANMEVDLLAKFV